MWRRVWDIDFQNSDWKLGAALSNIQAFQETQKYSNQHLLFLFIFVQNDLLNHHLDRQKCNKMTEKEVESHFW